MTQNFLQLLRYVITLCMLFYPGSFVLAFDQYPWYFYPNKVEESWDIAKNKGEGVVVDVLDSEIDFTSTFLKGKEYNSSTPNYYYKIFDNAGDAAELHGTAMVGLIVGDKARLTCDDASKKACNSDGKIAIAGIAPKAKILSRVRYPKGDLYDALTDSINEELPCDKIGQPRRKVQRSVKLILINVSGGNNDGQIISKIK